MLVIVIVLLAGAPVLAQDDVADVPSERIELKGKQVYFLIGADAKEQKPRPLLLVLPGGDGSEEFNGFVKRMWKNALPKEFVVAQLVAVSSDKPQQNVWPTAKVKDAKQDFSTESFVADVVADVGKRVKIDRERVYALGWSSSGPALYTMAATPNTPVKGYFIAMSVFRANIVVNQQALKGKKVFLYHSPEDQMCPMRMAKEGEAALTKAGAKVKFVEYQGGHGWRGNVFGDIRAGVEWLEKKEAGK
jgi:predicted esterase